MTSELLSVEMTEIAEIFQALRRNCQFNIMTSPRERLKHRRYLRHLHRDALPLLCGSAHVRRLREHQGNQTPNRYAARPQRLYLARL
jgi:hypothetical protein